MIGYDKRTAEIGVAFPPDGLIVTPAPSIKAGWVDLLAWSRDDAEELGLLGPDCTLYRHVGAWLGDPDAPGDVLLTFPRDIKSRWLRASADGETQLETHAVGEARIWAAGSSGPETLTIDDFPLRVQVWQRGGIFVARKAIASISSPLSLVAGRLAP